MVLQPRVDRPRDRADQVLQFRRLDAELLGPTDIEPRKSPEPLLLELLRHETRELAAQVPHRKRDPEPSARTQLFRDVHVENPLLDDDQILRGGHVQPGHEQVGVTDERLVQRLLQEFLGGGDDALQIGDFARSECFDQFLPDRSLDAFQSLRGAIFS